MARLRCHALMEIALMKEKPVQENRMHRYDYCDTPQGRMLLVATDRGLAGVYFVGQKHYPKLSAEWTRDSTRPATGEARAPRILRRQAQGVQRSRSTRSARRSSARCGARSPKWRSARRSPTPSSRAVPAIPGSARAAGAATGRNPLGIIVPCHRIVGTNGSLTGYAGGLSEKKGLPRARGRLDPGYLSELDSVRCSCCCCCCCSCIAWSIFCSCLLHRFLALLELLLLDGGAGRGRAHRLQAAARKRE
jgi:methylated-DNA-[protein]-cysteine S-methyltransferase